MAERAFFGPPQPDKVKNAVGTQNELKLYFTENDQLQQQHHHHPSFHALQASSSHQSSAHAHALSSSSHDPCPSSHAACSSASYHAYHRHHQHPYDHLHHHHLYPNHHEYPHLLDELRTCAKLKAEIVAHPLFDNLVQAHVQCLSVGVSSQHMQAMEAQLATRHSIIIKYLMLGKNGDDQGAARVSPLGCRKEIDNFMENYLQLLISWKKQLEELVIPPTIKALSTLCEIEQAFCDLTGVSSNQISNAMRTHEEWEDMCLDLELDASDYGIESQSDIDRSLFEHVRMELKNKLKDSYRENIQAMREEIIRKRQAGKLPGDITALKKWWNAHSRWPYPTEEEKRKLVQETGLEMRQINNWFINHRKRNWVDRHPPPPPTSNAVSAGSSSLQQQG